MRYILVLTISIHQPSLHGSFVQISIVLSCSYPVDFEATQWLHSSLAAPRFFCSMKRSYTLIFFFIRVLNHSENEKRIHKRFVANNQAKEMVILRPKKLFAEYRLNNKIFTHLYQNITLIKINSEFNVQELIYNEGWGVFLLCLRWLVIHWINNHNGISSPFIAKRERLLPFSFGSISVWIPNLQWIGCKRIYHCHWWRLPRLSSKIDFYFSYILTWQVQPTLWSSNSKWTHTKTCPSTQLLASKVSFTSSRTAKQQ